MRVRCSGRESENPQSTVWWSEISEIATWTWVTLPRGLPWLGDQMMQTPSFARETGRGCQNQQKAAILLDTNALDSYRQERHHLTSPSLDKKMANIAILQSLSVTENPIPPSNDRAQSKIKIASTHANRKWTDTQKDLLMDAFLRGSTKELLLSNINVSLHNLKRGDVVKLCGATASLLYVFTTNLFLINRLISFYLAA
jgi:hypothetical protein